MDVSDGGLVVKWSSSASLSELWQHSLLAEFLKKGGERGGEVKGHKAIGALLRCHCCGGPDRNGC